MLRWFVAIQHSSSLFRKKKKKVADPFCRFEPVASFPPLHKVLSYCKRSMWIRNAYSAAARKDATAIYSPMVKKRWLCSISPLFVRTTTKVLDTLWFDSLQRWRIEGRNCFRRGRSSSFMILLLGEERAFTDLFPMLEHVRQKKKKSDSTVTD